MSTDFNALVEKYKKKNKYSNSGTVTVQSSVNSKEEEEFLNLVEKYKQNDVSRRINTQAESGNTSRTHVWDKLDEEDIAPVRKDKEDQKEDDSLLDFFQKGSFKDGFDWHDIPTAILGTAGDAALGVTKGFFGLSEGIGDVLSYGVAGVADLVGGDRFAEGVRDFAQRNVVEEITSGADKYLNQYSVLGRTSDAVTQGIGQVAGIIATGGLGAAAGLGAAGTTALTTGVMGLSGMGSGMSEAYKGGATDEEALKYGAAAGASDALWELLFGGMGKAINAVGFSKGLSSLDDIVAKGVTKAVSNPNVRNVLEFAVKSGFEGLEEVGSGFTQAVAKKLTYMSEEEFGEILKDENLLEQFIVGAATSGITQSGAIPGMQNGSLMEANKTGRDFITGYSQNEQAVIDKEIENRIAEREKDGKKLTDKEKSDIAVRVEADMEKGYISTDTIEEVLGGDTYKSYRDTVKSEDDLVKQEKTLTEEYNKLNKMVNEKMTGEQQVRRDELRTLLPELRTKIEDQKKNSQRDQLKTKLSEEVKSLVQGDRLVESYNEIARRGQAFEADLNQYEDPNARKTVENFMGVVNNTNKAHAVVDFLAKVSKDTGQVFKAADAKKFGETALAIKRTKTLEADGTTAEFSIGSTDISTEFKPVVTVNSKVVDNYTVDYKTGKITFDAAPTGEVKVEFRKNAIVNGNIANGEITVDIRSKKYLESIVGHEVTHVLEKTDFYKPLQEAIFEYAKSKGEYETRLKKLQDLYNGVEGANVEAELTADLVGDYLFQDSDFINKLSTENRNVFQKVYDEIKHLLKLATAGSDQARKLEQVKYKFDQAWKDLGKAEKNTADSGVKYSLVGRTADGLGIYQTNYPKNTPKAVKQADLIELVQNAWSSKPITLTIVENGEYVDITAKFNPELSERSDLAKIAFGNRKGKAAEQRMTLDLASDLYQIAEESRFTYSKDAIPKPNNPAHDGVTKYHYFLTNLVYKDDAGNYIPSHMNIDVKRNSDGDWFYSFAIEKGSVPQALLAAGTDKSATLPSNNVPNNGNVVNGEFSLSDSTGRQLSEEQAEYLKDSKVRDENGNLKVMYHGTPSGAFTVFKDGTYFTDNKEYADRYQNPGASSISTGKTATNPKTFEVYLDIKKPFDLNDAEARRIYIEDYIKGGNAMGINPYLSDAEYAKIKTIDWTEGEDLRDFLTENGYDYDGLVLDEGADGGYGDEVQSRGTSYVVFSPEQVKSVDNQSPTSDPDIRFSLSEAVEETNELMAIHNLTGEKLLKSLKLGGLPMPSIAIAKAKAGHGEFGEISLVLNKDTIDPQISSRNKLYSGDAWTPTYPKVDYKPNGKVLRNIESKIDGLVPYEVQKELGSLMFDTDNVSNYLDRYNGSMVEAYSKNDAMKYAYLKDTGADITLPTKEENLYWYGNASNDAVRYFSGKLVNGLQTVELYQNMSARDVLQDKVLTEAVADAQNFDVLRTLEPGSDEYLEYERNPVFRADEVSFRDVNDFLAAARKLLQYGVQQTVDRNAAKDLIGETVDQAAYENWLQDLFSGVVEKEGIRNNKDYFTPSGNRRSFEALHYEHNLENVIKAMREKGEKGIGFGGGSIFGAATTEFASIEEMKKYSNRLQHMSEEQFQAIKDSFTDRFFALATSLPNNKTSFSATDDAANALIEAVAKYKTRNGIANYLRRELKGWATYSDQAVNDLIDLVDDIRRMPTGYFEAKPQRAVGFDEVAAFVIPYDADVKLKQELLNRGYSIAEYDPKVEGDRQRVINQFEDLKFSLSDAVETPKRYGDRATLGSEIAYAPVKETQLTEENSTHNATVAENATVSNMESVADMFPDDTAPIQKEYEFLLAEREDIKGAMDAFAAVGNYDGAEQLMAEYEAVQKRIAEIEADDAARFASIDEADAPPEIENDSELDSEPEDVADNVPLTKVLVTELAKQVKGQLGLGNNRTAEVRELIERYSNEEFPSKAHLYTEIQERFGKYTEAIVDEDLKGIKSLLRTYGINVDESIKGEIADYGQLMRSNFGKVRFAKDGLPVDVAYKEFQEVLPGYFPESIYVPTDQLMRIIEVANMDTTMENEYEIDWQTLEDVTDTIMNGVAEFKQNRKETLANRHGRESFNSLMEDADQFVPPIPENIAPVRPAIQNVQADPDDIAPVFDTSSGQQALMPEEEAPKKITRSDLHFGIMDNIKTEFRERGFDFDEVLKKAKDLPTFATVDNTPQRVMEKALGYKEGQVLSDLTVNQVAQNETEGIRWLNSFTDKKSGLLAKISKQYGIKPGSKASAAAQMYAEGFYVGENEAIIEYGDKELAADFPDAKTQENIKKLARDPRIRQIYDETLAAINASRIRNAYPEIPRLDNYFLHFRAMEDTFSRLGLPFNPNDIRAKDLPTDLNGVTADLKPGQPYFASAKHRLGKRTSFDLLGGLEKYLTSAKNQIYHIDDIQTLRALRNYVAETYGQATGLQDLDLLSDEEAEQRIHDVYNSHLSTFAKFLNEEANVLAGKTSLIDRGLEGVIGRRGITFLDTLNKQVGANMVGFNVSSSLTNFIAPVQALAKSNKADFVKAIAQTAYNKIGSIFGKGDNFAEDSPVMIRRKGAEQFYRTPYQKVADTGYVLMGVVDDISTELIARTKYNELTRKGMDSQQAHYETDKWVSRLMGDRSLGQQPQIYNSKMLGLFTKFQLEVRNQLDSQFYDTIQEAKVSTEEIENKLLRNAKKAAKITSTFAQLAVMQHLFGKAFESVAGYNPAFDIIEALINTFGWDDEEDDEDTVLDNIEQGFMELMGDMPYVSTLTGGRIPISSALPIGELYKGEDQYGNEKSRWETIAEAAPYYLLPGGYGQIKKTKAGIQMFDEDLPIAGSYTDSGNLRFPVEDTTGNRVQAALFGQWASENARDYFDNERKPLKEKQIQEFIDSDMPIRDYWDYREGLAEHEKLEDKADYIADLDLPISTKNMLINNISDRKEDIDLADYDEYSGLEELDFATKHPEKYEVALAVGGYAQYMSYREGMKEMKLAEKVDYVSKLNLSVEQKNLLINSETDRKEPIDLTGYENFSNFEEFEFAKENPEAYAMAKTVGGYESYKVYSEALGDIKADKDEFGNSISGTRKTKVTEYIYGLDIPDIEKHILFKSQYPSTDDFNYEIVDYLNGRSDMTFEEKIEALRKLDFDVDAAGNIYW